MPESEEKEIELSINFSPVDSETETAKIDFEEEEKVIIVRLDKWLWAARFFKTRALARNAVEKGLIFLNNNRTKPSTEIQIGDVLYIRQGRFEKEIKIVGLSTRRKSVDDARALYEIIQDFSSHGNSNNSSFDNNSPSQTSKFLRRRRSSSDTQKYNQFNSDQNYSDEDNKYNQVEFNYNNPIEFEHSANANKRFYNKRKNFNNQQNFQDKYIVPNSEEYYD